MIYNKKKILDIEMPDITTYPIYAHFCAIMQPHKETREWMLSNFLQICSNLKVLNFYDFNYRYTPYLNVQRIGKSFLKECKINIIDFIIKSISNGFYVYLLVKKKYISAYELQTGFLGKLNESVHNILVYGYDVQERDFYVADNFVHGKYAFLKCTFEEMENAVRYMRSEDEDQGGFGGTIELIEYRNGVCLDLSVRRIYEGLIDYYECKPTGMWNIMEIRNFNRNRNWFFGQKCYEYLEEQILKLNYYPIQDYQLMWEHKKHFESVLEYLIGAKYIYDESTVQIAKENADQALCARNLILKYNMTGDYSIKQRVIEHYKEIRQKESELFYKVIKQLELCDMERLMCQNK